MSELLKNSEQIKKITAEQARAIGTNERNCNRVTLIIQFDFTREFEQQNDGDGALHDRRKFFSS